MQLAKWSVPGGGIEIGAVQDEGAYPLDLGAAGFNSFGDFLAADGLEALADKLVSTATESHSLDEVTLLAPIDSHEVWAAGVTYQRSQQARREESDSAGSYYDLVYTADRPELFFKATPHRVVGPGEPVRVRQDSSWSVPEPELALVLSAAGKLIGFTVGNDMSARDIEGANPLYLPQAKVYDACCALGPVITLVGQMPSQDETTVSMQIRRGGKVEFDGSTSLSNMRRTYDDLIHWLFRENRFPAGVVLMTGTGIVPPDEFSLEGGDEISISISGIGMLTNPVVVG